MERCAEREMGREQECVFVCVCGGGVYKRESG